MASGAQGQNSPAAAINATGVGDADDGNAVLPALSGTIDKSRLTPAEQKLGSDLLRLADSSYLLPGQTTEALKAGMQRQKQLIPRTAMATNGKSAGGLSSDLVYVYVFLNPGVSSQSIVPYVWNLTAADDKNNLAVAWVDVGGLEKLAAFDGVRCIQTVESPLVNTGSVTAESDAIMRTANVRSTYGYTGAGVKIGVISDGVDDIAEAQASGDLPSDVQVLDNNYGGSEGTAMLEIIHDEAPEADLYFHDCGTNWVDFNSAIDDLAASGCTVIVDDIYWTSVPFFADGIIASHISDLVDDGDIIYLSCAGNYAQGHFQGLYYPDGISTWADFSYGTESYYKYLFYDVDPYDGIMVALEWNDAYGASDNDYDLYLYNADGTSILAYSENIQSGTQNPFESLYWMNPNTTASRVILAVNNYNGLADAKTLEIVSYSGGGYALPYNVNPADSISGHAAVSNVVTVGAIDASDSGNDNIEPYSSNGPSTLYTPGIEVRQKPDIAGIDGVRISGAGDWGSPSGGNYYFYGTSAAAPSIAGLAALIWSGYPEKTAAEIRSALLSSAVDLGAADYDNVFGNGRGDAVAMQETLTMASVSGTVTTQYMAGVADAYVALINATDHGVVYGTTSTDSLGNYVISNIDDTDGWVYHVYASSSLLGSGYSNPFTIASAPPQVNVIIATMPYHILVTTNESAVDLSPDVIEVSAYVTDVLDYPLSGERIVFTANNSLGSFAAVTGTAPAGASQEVSTTAGYAKVRYGWAAAEGATCITATYGNNPLVNASVNLSIVHMPPDEIRLSTTASTLLANEGQAILTAQLYFMGAPCSKSGVTVTFSSNDTDVGYLPLVNVNLTDAGGETMMLLNAMDAGAVKVTASVTAGNGSVVRDSTDVEVFEGGSISGIVRDMYQKTVPGATVSLWETTQVGSDYVNSGLYSLPENPQLTSGNPFAGPVGGYSFDQVPSGVYNVTVEKTDAEGQTHLGFAIVSLTQDDVTADIAMPDYIQINGVGRKPIELVDPPAMDGSHPEEGGVAGKVSFQNAGTGIANAYVAIVNASNTSQAYYVGTTDSQGLFQFVQISNTWSAATGAYEPIYRLYANHSLFGDAYSVNFSVRSAATTAVNVMLLNDWTPTAPHAPGSAPSWPVRSITYAAAPVMQETQCPGAVYGRLTKQNTDYGMPGAYVEIVNAADTGEAYYVTQTDANGYFLFTGVNHTYDAAQGTYQDTYVLYSYDGRLGEAFSNIFAVESNSTSQVNLIIYPIPARADLSAPRDYVVADETDTIELSTYVTDALGEAVADNTQITYTINNGGSYNYSNNGSFDDTPGQTVTIGTVDGYANVTFGRAPANGTSVSVPVRVAVADNESVYNSTVVFLHHKNVAPEIRWSRTYGGSGTDTGYSVRQADDGGYIVAGSEDILPYGYSGGYLIRTSENGNVLWSKTFEESERVSFFDVQSTTDGGFIVAGSRDKAYLLKTDAGGTEEWNSSFGNDGDSIESVQQTADGGYITTGWAWTGSGEAYLAKSFPNGTLDWYRTYGGPGQDTGFSVLQTTDGGYAVTGFYDSNWPYGDWRVYLFKTDASGELAWEKYYDSTVREFGQSVQQTADGGYIITGYSTRSANDVDVLLIKTDSDGNALWTNLYNVTGCDYGTSVQTAPDGGYLLSGYTDPDGGAFLIKTDASGNRLWDKMLWGNTSAAYSVILSADGGYIVVGNEISGTSLDVSLAEIGGIDLTITGNTGIAPGTAFTGTVTLSDPDADTWNVTVNFGDDSPLAYMDTGAYTFALPEHVYTDEGDYIVNVSVRDNFGNVKSAIAFVAVSSSSSYILTLGQGWNIFSIPIEPESREITSIFSPEQQSNIDVIWDFNNGDWKFWTTEPGYTNQFSTISPLRGYNVYCYAPMSVEITGTPASGPIPMSELVSGWNMIGFPSMTNTSISSLYGTTDVVWKLENNNWYYWTTEPGYTNQFDDLSPGLGYWVYKY